MNVVTNGGAKVVFIGDSITHNWETAGKSQLRKYFSEGDCKMLNLGISGDRTEHVLWRLNEGGELDGYEAKCILLMIGTNNTGHFPVEKEPPADTILGIREILRTIRAKQPKAMVVLSPIFPRGRDANDRNRIRNEVVNREIRKFADGKTVFWCDFNAQFMTADARLSPALFPDLLHPRWNGYEIWYSAVKPYIDAALSDGCLPAPANRYAPCLRPENVRLDQPFARYPGTCIDRRFDETDGWLDRLMGNRNQIAESKGEIDVVMLGDSITHNWELTGASSLAELRKTYTVLNAGYGGDRTENLLWRVKYGGELDGYKAKVVALMIGTNNAGHRKDRPEDIAAAIGDILAVIAEKQPDAKVLLMPIFPCGANAQDANRVITDAVNKLIRGCADGERVLWVDFNDKFVDETGDPIKWMADRLHPNEAAYREIWMPVLVSYLERFVRK